MDCDCDIRDCICEPVKNPAAVALGALGGKIGGKARTKKKAAAARRNGKKGGRPKKLTNA